MKMEMKNQNILIPDLDLPKRLQCTTLYQMETKKFFWIIQWSSLINKDIKILKKATCQFQILEWKVDLTTNRNQFWNTISSFSNLLNTSKHKAIQFKDLLWAITQLTSKYKSIVGLNLFQSLLILISRT